MNDARPPTPLRRLARLGAPTVAALMLLAAPGCVTAEEAFVGPRLQDLCNASIPVCSVQASCVLGEGRFLRTTFPGGERLIVRTEEPEQTLVLRMFLSDERFPGTELVVQAYSPTCAGYDEDHLRDVDIFRVAGDDRVLEFHLRLPEKGDHLVEVFSDMTATYLLTVDIEPGLPDD